MKPTEAPHQSSQSGPARRRRLGAGRSGQVFEEILPDGRSLACKVFLPDRASSLVNLVLTGAVNPYRWNAHAVECAVLRRRILAPLVELWFQGALRLPETHGSRWDGDHRAFELRAERVQGRHTQLQHSLRGGDADEVVADRNGGEGPPRPSDSRNPSSSRRRAREEASKKSTHHRGSTTTTAPQHHQHHHW